LVSYHFHLQGFILVGSSDKIAGFEKPPLRLNFITQKRGFSNAMDKIFLNNVYWVHSNPDPL
jgi:hypothetical protein